MISVAVCIRFACFEVVGVSLRIFDFVGFVLD